MKALLGRLVTYNFSYFDLESSPKQNTYFGIAVSSPYGRVLSQFDIDHPWDHKELSMVRQCVDLRPPSLPLLRPPEL